MGAQQNTNWIGGINRVCAGIAQLVEQRFCKPLVGGSNPSLGTIFRRIMMRTVWKFSLRIANSQSVMMPRGAKILSVQAQGPSDVCLWALVNDEEVKKEPRNICIHGTGHEIYDGEMVYINTFQTHDGALIWHVFEHIS